MPKGYTKYVDEEFPELVKYFENKEDAHIGVSSNKKKNFICECCNKVFSESVRQVVNRNESICITCRDGVSYPEKYMCSVLDQLNVKFDLHYHSEWTNKYFYDFAFSYKDKKYIIEMDGGLGHGHYGFHNCDVSKSIEEDKEKDKLATENGYKMIRIDCNYNNNYNGRFKHITENVIKKLGNIFNLENVDFDKCNEFALSSLFYKIVNYYKTESKYINDICNTFHLKETCVKKYLKHAMSIGLLPYEYLHNYDRFADFPVKVIHYFDDEKVRNSKILYCYDDAIAFDSVKALSEYLGAHVKTIPTHINLYDGKIKGKRYCYYDDLPNDFDFKPIKSNKTRYKPIYQYSKDRKKLINKYENKLFLPPEFDYINVNRVCNGKRNSHKGFWWSNKNIFEKEQETA